MWIYVIALIVGLCFASLLYLFNSEHYSKALSTTLFLLRSITISVVVLLFFNPFLKQKSNRIEPATIVVAQDNSSSLVMTKDSLFYKNHYPLALDSLLKKLEDKFVIDKYLFGDITKEFQNIDYQDNYTDINNVLEHIKKTYYKRNVGAVILLSDGINNKSYSPEQNIESYPFPIYTVTLGDTCNYPDLYIKDVRYNKTTPSNTIFPLKVVANARNCRNKTMEIKVLINNEIIKTSEIDINSNRFSKTFDFNIYSEEEGVKQIDIQINTLDNEQITQNNRKRIFIEVIDKQYKVLFYAYAPHPDLGSLKNILGDRFMIETIFSEDEIPDFHEYDIVFLHQIPYFGMDNTTKLSHELEKNENTPVFYIIGENTDLEALNKLQDCILLERGTVNSLLDIKPHYNQTFGLYNLDKQLIESINNFPPLSLPHLNFSIKTSVDILLTMNILDIVTQTPLMSFSSDNKGRKMAFLLGTGIWRWKLYDYYRNNNYDNFEELFSKSVKYLLTEKDKELIINYKESYLNTESINFTADLRNPSQELTTEPNLRITIINKHSKDKYEYDFYKNKDSYYLNISTLPEGVYIFEAIAEFGKNIYRDHGSFSVISIGVEAQDLVANAQRMQNISTLTGAKNLYINELNHLYKIINDDERITSIMREETNYKDLINWKLILYITLSLITIEWILRKMFGTY